MPKDGKRVTKRETETEKSYEEIGDTEKERSY